MPLLLAGSGRGHVEHAPCSLRPWASARCRSGRPSIGLSRRECWKTVKPERLAFPTSAFPNSKKSLKCDSTWKFRSLKGRRDHFAEIKKGLVGSGGCDGKSSRRTDTTSHLGLNRQFHFIVYRASGSAELVMMIEQIWLRIVRSSIGYPVPRTAALDRTATIAQSSRRAGMATPTRLQRP